MDVNQSILENINRKCGGKVELMSFADKLVYRQIVLKWLEDNYEALKFWSELDLEKELQVQKEPDFVKLRNFTNRIGGF